MTSWARERAEEATKFMWVIYAVSNIEMATEQHPLDYKNA